MNHEPMIYSEAGIRELSHTQIAKAILLAVSRIEKSHHQFYPEPGERPVCDRRTSMEFSDGQSKKDQSILSLGWAGGFQDCVGLRLNLSATMQTAISKRLARCNCAYLSVSALSANKRRPRKKLCPTRQALSYSSEISFWTGQ